MAISQFEGMEQVYEAQELARKALKANPRISVAQVAKRVGACVKVCVYATKKGLYASFVTQSPSGSKGAEDSGTFEKRTKLYV